MMPAEHGLASWDFQDRPPASWADILAECDGTLFHSPAALGTPGVRGVPRYGRLMRGDRTEAAVMCLWRRCSYSMKPRHVEILAPPLLGSVANPREVLHSLVRVLESSGASEVTIGSYGASYALTDEKGRGTPGPERLEFRVPLSPDPSELLENMSSSHRRKIRGGDSSDWILERVGGDRGKRILSAVQGAAADRRERKYKDSFEVVEAEGIGKVDGQRRYSAWGTEVFVVKRGEVLLAAALVGWGGLQSFYVSGGSTPLGYQESAAFWLHWRVMQHLGTRGFRSYNLGGVPAGARDRGHPQHGLRRFKLGFGAEEVTCQGRRFTLKPAHLRWHRLGDRVKRIVRSHG